jgi:2-methylcitrate dehydratase PrpD
LKLKGGANVMPLINDLVFNMLRLGYEDLPGSVIEVAKKSVLDTLAVIIAGSSADGIGSLVKLIKGWGGRKESTILVHGGKVPAISAALANSTMARARDLDDVHERAAMHLSATIVPSAFVLSEYSRLIKSRLVNGKEFILAIALGSEFLCRLRLAGPGAPHERGWSSETPAPLAVAMMGGKMLGFDKEKMLNSLGIAYAQCSGNIQAHAEGVLTVRLQQGFGSMSGILSLLLADEGLTGAKDVLEGEYGYYALYMRGRYNPDVLIKDFGRRFEVGNVSIKSYPSCKYTHTAILGALQLAEENKITADSIKKVIISTSPHGYALCGGERKIIPKSVPDAQFSYYYTVAVALEKGKVFINDFSEDAIRNDKVLSMSKRVEVIADPKKEKLKSVLSPIDITIETKDGRTYKKSVKLVKGHPDYPMTFSDLYQKLEDCAFFSARPLSLMRINKIKELVEHLEEIDDVTMILKFLGDNRK